ncbi:trpD: anthranilate phosphoribosyltransferase [Rubrobacter radiotolerans]|uniref:Anthranilate phosphoribosyltransferase n=1 Tax=Rubrobacter radiotolerans TaxID=42256 RepID=A0A023X3X2_RUBRA|nr:anthranilate phosphoribosyltransferase [Rubrobacter radiotolerans]AHY47162.1 trpD: anthranilate phosphoribosyltransferase [Rubrobacter radiotolerans]MDX5894567.1 anthranilate phosphoribosyltransferase [Rubrobacter radiotolerans]SMC06277.1 anthranilate phosphoribosyltransferase [Rubrobacter radiotolerans DSM 5868]
MLRESLRKVADGEALSGVEAERALEEIMSGTVPPEATAALLTALRVRGESPQEILGFARAMRRFSAKVEAPEDATDIVGTGGDAKGTINVSTTAAFVARGAGVTVAKHGNRAATSRSGSADVLEALGAEIELSPQAVSRCIEEAGIGFMFARTHHPAMRHVAPVRAGLPFRTIFNLLGPLTNPAGARRLVVGVFSGEFVRPMAEALAGLGVDRALVVHGRDGLDELTVSDRTLVCRVEGTHLEEYDVEPGEFGLSRYPLRDLVGGDAQLNARILRDVLSGEERGAARDIVLLNAGAAVFAGGRAKSLASGVERAREAVESGAATAALRDFVAATRRLARQ